MENGHLHDDKLFRAVHDRLSDYEAPSDGADWDAMSRSLDALPKATRFQFRISLNSILVAVGVLGISVLGYALATHTSSPSEKAQPEVVLKENIVPVKQNTTVTNTQVVSQPQPETQTNIPPMTNSALQMQNYQDNPNGQTTTALVTPEPDLSDKKQESTTRTNCVSAMRLIRAKDLFIIRRNQQRLRNRRLLILNRMCFMMLKTET